MRVRPRLTIEAVFSLHESVEREHPLGSEGRWAFLEAAHQLYLDQAALLRRFRQLPNDRDFAKFKTLADMVLLDARTMEQMSFRALARTVLGRKATEGSTDRLARKYAKFLHACPDLGRKATGGRGEKLPRELWRDCVGRIDRLAPPPAIFAMDGVGLAAHGLRGTDTGCMRCTLISLRLGIAQGSLKKRLLVREILIHGADGDAGPLRHPRGGKSPFAHCQQNLNGRFEDSGERGLSARLPRRFAGF